MKQNPKFPRQTHTEYEMGKKFARSSLNIFFQSKIFVRIFQSISRPHSSMAGASFETPNLHISLITTIFASIILTVVEPTEQNFIKISDQKRKNTEYFAHIFA